MMGRATNLILGTAGHIDHGKTALVHALTGVDTDRLVEEKTRGITIELGFAPYAPTNDCAFGIVDVPGHEGFVRAMVAGATGMDLVLLVVAADEGVMPQTREHMAIVRLLDVGAIVVAITKADLVDDEWLELVREDVQDLLEGTPYRDAEVIPTSIRDPASLAALSVALVRCGSRARARTAEDLFRLPVDRVFAVEGTGTVVTGTLWSGRLARGEVVRLLPRGGDARVRALQVHGKQVTKAVAGQRTAVALTGATVRRGLVARGDVLVTDPGWRPSMMLTVELLALAGTGWKLEPGQRVRVHLGTVEIMARLALFDAGQVAPGSPTLAQLRLESAVVARSGDRFVVRSYSPVTTIAGGVVLEPAPPKRKRLTKGERAALTRVSRGGDAALAGAAALAGWAGLDAASVGVL
ncbi:MAG: selenocysteine-specific translation elongation factor, partial [Gemmatimonadetes bacterium]|nr:selenocysteine-specific translation elongation factor [Gemmatimonadota bacterium]